MTPVSTLLPGVNVTFVVGAVLSHVVTVRTEVRDLEAVAAACRRLELEAPLRGRFKMYSQVIDGWGVKLPGWLYPVVLQPETGVVQFDNFEGHWGDQAQLDRFLQGYAVEKATLEARRRGHTVAEQTLDDGSVKLTLTAGGSA